MPDEELADVRRRTSSGDAWYIRAWATLLVVTAVTAALHGRTTGAVVAGVLAAVLLVASVVLRRRQLELLEALGDRGQVARTDRYHRRDRMSQVWGSLILVGWFVANLSSFAVGDRPGDQPGWTGGVGAVLALVGAAGWLAVRTRMYLAGDDLDEPTEQDRDGVEPGHP